MSWRRRRRRRVASMPIPPHAGMNLVPLVDMALNLVLILLIMAPAMYMVRLPVRLPQAEASKDDTNDWLRVTLAEDGRVSVDGDIIESWERLPEALRKKMKEVKKDIILLEIDRRVPYRTTARALDIVRGAAAVRVAFATAQKNNGTPAP